MFLFGLLLTHRAWRDGDKQQRTTKIKKAKNQKHQQKGEDKNNFRAIFWQEGKQKPK